MNNKIVYWAKLLEYSDIPKENLYLYPLLKELTVNQSESGGDYISCPAIRGKHMNTFFSVVPFDIDADFSSGILKSNNNKITQRKSAYKDSYAFDLRVDRIFFCETSQIMETSPAFLHNTSYSTFGHAPSGSFDIGQWFRPSSPNFQLWDGVNKFTAKSGEPHLYFNFPSDYKIELKQFNMTQRLKSIMMYNLTYKKHVKNQPLEKLYSNFKDQKDTVVEEIKNNVI